MKKEIGFALIAYTRDDEFSRAIEFPLMRQSFVNVDTKQFMRCLKGFIDECQGREDEIMAMLNNLAVAVNTEHAFDLDFKRLKKMGAL